MLWHAYDWLAALPSHTDFPTTTPPLTSLRISRTATHQSPSTVFRSIADPPYLPPIPSAAALLRSLVPTAPNPDLDPDRLPAEAAALLPSAPLGSAFIHDPEHRAAVISGWRRHLTRYPPGHPDGTGLRGSLLTLATDSFPFIALWLEALRHSRTTPAHRSLLASKTLGGQVKPDKRTRTLPTSAADVTAARPLARHPITRRLVAGHIARATTPTSRSLYTTLSQFGLIRAGLEVAPRRLQLHSDLRPPHLAHASLDIENAHTTTARLFTYLLLAARARSSPHSHDALFALYFLSYYHFPTATYIQQGASFELVWQTDGLDQGEALAAHAHGYALATLIHRRLLPAVPTVTPTLIHDDTTLTDFISHHPPSSSPPRTLDASLTPLPFAVSLFRRLLLEHLRSILAGHKSLIFQPPLPASHPSSLPSLLHLFPPGSDTTSASFTLAGTPVGTTTGILSALSVLLSRHSALLTRLASIPALSPQIRLIILSLSCRPTSLFALPLRTLTPLHTTRLLLPDSVFTFASALRHATLTAIARCLRVSPTLLLSPPSDSATATQLLLPATDSGIGHVDPQLLAPAAYLGGFADSLPALLTDHILHPTLLATHSWATSTSISLLQASSIFFCVTSLPAFSSPTTFPHPTSVPSLLSTSAGSFSLDLLHAAAAHRPQHVFARAVFSAITTSLLTLPLPHHVLARIRHCRSTHSTSLFTMYYVPATSSLTLLPLRFLYLHRLGVPLPDLPSPPLPHCLPRCPQYPSSRPIPPHHPLHPLFPHGIHSIACGLGGHRHRRHDALVRLIAAAARTLLGADVTTSSRLCSSSRSGTKVDLVFTSFDLLPYTTAVDVTVSCPLLPTYVVASSASASTLFVARSAEKEAKHLPGCVELHRAFLAIVFSSFGGIGPPPACEWLDSLFHAAFTTEYLGGGTGSRTAHRRLIFHQSLQATLARACADMLTHLTPTTATLSATAAPPAPDSPAPASPA